MSYYKVFVKNQGCVNCGKGGYMLEERATPRISDAVFGESIEISKDEYDRIIEISRKGKENVKEINSNEYFFP